MTVQQVKLNQYGYHVNEHVHAPYNEKEIHVHIHNVYYDSRNVTCILIDKVKYNKNVSATLSIFNLEIQKEKSTLMIFFFFIARAT